MAATEGRAMWGLMGSALALLLLAAGLLWQGSRAEAAGGWPSVSVETVATGFAQPIHVTNAGDGSGRLFVVERAGIVRLLRGDGSVAAAPFLDIRDRVQDAGGEEGLLSIAFPPNYAATRHFYGYYVNNSGNLAIARFRVPAATPDDADEASEELLLTIPHPGRNNHNGGQLMFGPDGFLYAATGDGGGGGDPDENGQSLDSLLGKMLRLDVEGEAGTAPYLVPPSNPFVGIAGRDEIWAYGLRNPWRFSFDRATGDLWIGDVGQNAWEEIDVQPASSAGGENYGWDCYEGSHPFEGAGCGAASGYTFPVAEYGHDEGCSVTGGYVYRGASYPALNGLYFFTDYCSGHLWATRPAGAGWETAKLVTLSFGLSSFGEDEGGELYLVNGNLGTLSRLVGPLPELPFEQFLPLIRR